MSRVDEAWNHDPRILWALIIEDEDTRNLAELGEIAERVFANAQEAWAENVRLHAQVHSLTGMLDHERRLHHGPAPRPAPEAAPPAAGMRVLQEAM